MGAVDKDGMIWVAPSFGVEVEAEDEVGLECAVDEIGAGADFGGAVEQSLGGFLDFGGRCFWAAGFAGKGEQCRGADGSHGLGIFSHKGNTGAEGFQLWFQKLGDLEAHVALANGCSFADDEPAFFHLRPCAADVAGVDGDLESG